MPEIDDKEKWICPITKLCTNSKLHRKCNYGEHNCRGEHCWDCCSMCHGDCDEPPKNAVDYDMPE